MVSIDFVSDSQQMKLYDYVEKHSRKHFRAFSKTCYFHTTVWAVGIGKYLKISSIDQCTVDCGVPRGSKAPVSYRIGAFDPLGTP